MTREELQAAIDAVPYWYHRIHFENGAVTPGWAPINKQAYRITDDLTDKSVLDIGAWDGYWTYEALKRGAKHVTAIDDFSDTIGGHVNANRSAKWGTFDLVMKQLGFRHDWGYWLRKGDRSVYRLELDVCKESESLGGFDHIFCFGVLYHLQHPLRALQNMRTWCTGTIHIETAILNGCKSAYTDRGYDAEDCCMEFYPTNEYGNNSSNWWVGTLKCWCKMVEAAGFKNVESWKLTDNPEHVSQCRGFIKAEV